MATADLGMFAVCALLAHAPAEAETKIAEPTRDARGVFTHDVTSSCQAGRTQIRVLLPEKRAPDEKLRVIYVLPVEAGTENRYGDGLAEILKRDLHNQTGAAFVFPTFTHLPWYADHPTDRSIRQETYFTKVVVPFIDAHYPVQADREGRLLLGYSKSGWGAWSLLLRHPAQFHRAVAWDAPLMMDQPGKYGSGPIFETAENFEKYRVTRLVEDRAEQLRREPRLILLGAGNFQPEHVRMHALLDELKVRHIYTDAPQRKHDWHSGWVPEGVARLLEQ